MSHAQPRVHLARCGCAGLVLRLVGRLFRLRHPARETRPLTLRRHPGGVTPEGGKPGRDPEGVVSTIKLEQTDTRVSTQVIYDDTKFLFTRVKLGEDSVESGEYKYSYWAYKVLLNTCVVFGIEAMHHWAGGKPELKEVTDYVPGPWEDVFQNLKAASEELARRQASEATAERRKTNAERRKEDEEFKLDRFGLNPEDAEFPEIPVGPPYDADLSE